LKEKAQVSPPYITSGVYSAPLKPLSQKTETTPTSEMFRSVAAFAMNRPVGQGTTFIGYSVYTKF